MSGRLYQARKISKAPRQASSSRIITRQILWSQRIADGKAQASASKIEPAGNRDGKRSPHPRTDFQKRHLPLLLVNKKLGIADAVVFQCLDQQFCRAQQGIAKRYRLGLYCKPAAVENRRPQDSCFHRTHEPAFVCSEVHIVSQSGRHGLHDQPMLWFWLMGNQRSQLIRITDAIRFFSKSQ